MSHGSTTTTVERGTMIYHCRPIDYKVVVAKQKNKGQSNVAKAASNAPHTLYALESNFSRF